MPEVSSRKSCPICCDPYVDEIRGLENGLFRVFCERCGTYDIDPLLINIHDSNKPWYPVKHLVSTWISRQFNVGIFPVVAKGASISEINSPEWWINKYRHMGFPETTDDKLNALLLVLANSLGGKYKGNVYPGKPFLISSIAANDIEEVIALTSFLVEFGYLRKAKSSIVDANYFECEITGKGWLQVDKLLKITSTSDSAFIAMWFHKHTKNYRKAVIASVEYCGYRAVVLDQEEYSDFIMDQVVTLIKQAKFVIADFTCIPETIEDTKVKNGVRGGVYWESGMAYGLGKPLIHTCEDYPESRARIHFDVDQYNTIFWQRDDLSTDIRPIGEVNNDPTFSEKFVARILALVGQGSYKAG